MGLISFVVRLGVRAPPLPFAAHGKPAKCMWFFASVGVRAAQKWSVGLLDGHALSNGMVCHA